jgi:hypothetical protein
MREFLESKKDTAILLTSLPEEMSLEESAEHQALLSKKLSLPLLLLNKFFPAPTKSKEKSKDEILQNAYDYSLERAKREHAAVKNFAKEHADWPILEIPLFFPGESEDSLVTRLAEFLEHL